MSVLPIAIGSPVLGLHERAASCRRADSHSPAEVADSLRRFLQVENLTYRESPQSICWGWETYTYRLQLEPTAELPSSLAGPLILRIYTNDNGVPRVRHEFGVQGQLEHLGFPVPKPLLLHTNCDLFDGPFVLMERIAGATLFHSMLAHPLQLAWLSARMAELHVRLHQLPTEGFATSGAGFLGRQLDEIHDLIVRYSLCGLQAGLDWLWRHRPTSQAEDAVVHLDWHPINLIRGAGNRLWALDWSESDVGDPHADVAMTLLLLRYAPVSCRNGWEKLAVPLGREWILRHYWNAYTRKRPIEEARLRYYLAWAALRRLAFYGRWLVGGPGSTGSKADVLHYLQTSHLAKLSEAFHDWTGVACGG
jgi:aminoglycoside phosphotransferase (APT) family kinase protein